jgi:hypothetical protein
LLRWFENIHKLNILPLNTKQYHWSQRKAKTNKKKIKKQGTCDNGQIWKSYQDAYFEPLWLLFSKLNLPIFLLIIQEHIKVITLEFANLAEVFSNSYNKHAKWQH